MYLVPTCILGIFILYSQSRCLHPSTGSSVGYGPHSHSHSLTQEHQLGVNFESYLLFLVKNTSRCRMDVPSSSKHDLASRSFFDPGHETQLQREVFFTIQNVYFFHDFSPKHVRKRVKKNFDEKYTICQLIWVAQVVFYHLDYPQSHPERPACLYINSYDHFIVVATSFRLRFLTSTARMRRAAKFFIWLC